MKWVMKRSLFLVILIIVSMTLTGCDPKEFISKIAGIISKVASVLGKVSEGLKGFADKLQSGNSGEPSSEPSTTPSSEPSSEPSTTPSSEPSSEPSTTPSSTPSSEPSETGSSPGAPKG